MGISSQYLRWLPCPHGSHSMLPSNPCTTPQNALFKTLWQGREHGKGFGAEKWWVDLMAFQQVSFASGLFTLAKCMVALTIGLELCCSTMYPQSCLDYRSHHP